MKNRLFKRGYLSKFTFIFSMLMTFSLTAGAWANEAQLWSKIKSGGHIVLMRHALAPGFGDPDGFTLGDCSTQRVLSEVGRQQAAQIGERFRDNGITEANVYSSPWCRCVDTAERLKLGEVTQSLNVASTFQQNLDGNPARNVAAVKQWIAGLDTGKPTVIVTHQVNITALTGQYSSSGDMVVVHVNGDSLEPVGTIETAP